jgi:hypothetical protein
MSTADMTGAPMSAPDLIRAFEGFGWDETFMRTARLAALLANGHGHEVRKVTHESLTAFARDGNPHLRRAAEYVAANPRRPIANEAALYFVEAMALLYGSEGGLAPSDSTLAQFLLAANDYCTDWRLPNSAPLTRAEANLVNLARASIHDDSSLGARKLARSRLLFEPAPPVPEWRDPQAWKAFQREAFGMPFEEYFEGFAAVLSHIVGGLLADPEEPSVPYPIVEPSLWFTARPQSKAVAEELRITREDAKREIKKTTEGLPIGPSLFYRRPLVEILPDKLVVASPWVLRELVSGGVWWRHMAAAKRLYGAKGGDLWLRAFGLLVEGWCQQVAGWAGRAPGFRGTVLIPEAPGTEEVEDIVILNKMDVALFSVKARMLKEDVLKGAQSDRGVIDWYNDFLFAKATNSFRGGAVRLLDAKVRKLRAGEFSAHVHPNALVLPVIVTYDDLGADNQSMTKWLVRRCHEENLLQQPRMRPLTMIDVDLFERLLGVATHGHAVTEMLKKRTKPPWDQGRLAELLRETIRPGEFGAVPELVGAYEAITRRIIANIFEKDPGVPDAGS